MTGMRLLGLIGASGSGKTHLLTRLLPIFIERGLSVSTIKHAHHGFDLDQPGKDSFQHRKAGAREVLIASARRWALMHEIQGPEPELAELVGHLSPVDLVLIEGFKASPHPKIEVHRAGLGHPMLWPDRSDVVAVASDQPLPGCKLPVLDLGNPTNIATWSLNFIRKIDAVQPRA
jgi:molybdopterin-guanine dinucleotide biosynthesis protein B